MGRRKAVGERGEKKWRQECCKTKKEREKEKEIQSARAREERQRERTTDVN